ncbi:NADPH:adrenodoxin oxidoreductase, mitochondrial [Musca vetustissima]|uniref:NADPH:adrenodoxin oxidoreductase, mitochondrial n=1 Tax=Musca vetustissima TaxID=27455 RepID=UPI002AB68496|nr:NADPH:adrenodoxin oxidoreductase, mitochondrial [Musca vetustissima]
MLRTILQRNCQLHPKNVSHIRFYSQNPSTRVCIVGAGPAGFYAAQHILKQLPNANVDVIDKLPVPFGLVRFGVAPDHPEVKNVINTFTKTAGNERFKFYGNVALGQDVSLRELRERYHIVLLTYGADQDRQLGIENEAQPNVLSARNFVAWYNGLPGAENLNPDLSGKSVTIVGQGNVAVDVARMLLSPIDELKKTDITSYALDFLAQSKVEKVYLVGRRGPLQVAFTIKELREMLRLPNVSTHWRPDDFNGVSEAIEKLARPRKRLTELMLKSLNEQPTPPKCTKQFLPIFLRSPKTLKEQELIFTINEMQQDKAVATSSTESLPADLVLRSIGYKSSCADKELCFDARAGMVANVNGRVLKNANDATSVDPGLYTAGWLATGPTGVILTTMNVAFSVAKTICDDVVAKKISTEDSKPGLMDLLKDKRYVNWQAWERIDAEETKRGQAIGKPREKIVSVEEMLKVAGL